MSSCAGGVSGGRVRSALVLGRNVPQAYAHRRCGRNTTKHEGGRFKRRAGDSAFKEGAPASRHAREVQRSIALTEVQNVLPAVVLSKLLHHTTSFQYRHDAARRPKA